MTVNALNAVMGPATIYLGDFAAPEPADSAVADVPSPTDWEDVGGTNGGTQININQEFATLTMDQIIDIAGRRMTGRDMQVQTSLAEVTLENLKKALNGGTTSSGTGFKKYEPAFSDSATQPQYKSLIVDGWAPGADQVRRRFILRRVLSIANVGIAYTKDGQTLFPVTWGIHFVNSNTPPFAIIDEV